MAAVLRISCRRLLPIQKVAFHLTYSQAGLVATMLNVTSSMIQPIFGLISDRWKTDWFIGLQEPPPDGPVRYGSTCLLLLGVDSGLAPFIPRASMTANYLSGARRGLGMAIYALGGNLGFALGPIFAAFVVLRWGAGSTAWLSGFPSP